MITAVPILSASEMRDAEMAMVGKGVSLAELMHRAGAALADVAWRIAAGRPIHILCGPGNNGGDGYVAARILRERSSQVAVSSLCEPTTDLAQTVAAQWGKPIGKLNREPLKAAVLVDCLFGTGLTRGLAPEVASALLRHAEAAHLVIAADVPSGVNGDSGELLGCPIHADVTLAFGAFKPAHMLFPAAAHCGTVELARLGIEPTSRVSTATMPRIASPNYASHKYSRGMVAVVAGAMSGAAELAALGALRSGAGYALLVGSRIPATSPFAIVRRSWRDVDALNDPRIGAIIVGPGLGHSSTAKTRFDAAIAAGKPLIIDADGLAFLPATPFAVPAILTPHSAEFARLSDDVGDKITVTRALAERKNAVVVHKGADTVIAAPDGRVAVQSPGCPWLASAGTGDVLAGMAGAMLSRGIDAFDAAQAAVLLHQRAALRVGPGLIADDLVAGPLWP